MTSVLSSYYFSLSHWATVPKGLNIAPYCSINCCLIFNVLLFFEINKTNQIFPLDVLQALVLTKISKNLVSRPLQYKNNSSIACTDFLPQEVCSVLGVSPKLHTSQIVIELSRYVPSAHDSERKVINSDLPLNLVLPM